MRLLPFLALIVLACGSEPDDKPQTSRANPCATPGATYLASSVQTSGNCPDFPDEIVNVGNDGTLPGPVSCDRIEQDGCRAHNTNCVTTTDHCRTTSTFTTTFTDDGASADGLATMSIECDDGETCRGTFETHFERQD